MDNEESKLLLLISPSFHHLNKSIQEDIFRSFYHLNYSYIMHMINDHNAAEDIIQDAFIKTLYKGPPIGNEYQLKAWIRVLVRNTTLNYLRKIKKMRNEVDLESVFINEELSAGLESVESVEQQVEVKLLEEWILKHLKEMKSEYRLLIELKWKNHLSYKEIAQAMNSTENVIRQKIHRAREALKKKLNLKRGTPDD